MSEPGLTSERLREVILYDKSSGKFTWKVSRRAGKTVGTVDAHGYVLIRVDGRLYRACRLAWLYVNGEWPQFQVDHINLNRADDRWSNLRSATNSQNNANRLKPANNTTGFKGVYRGRGRHSETWNARIKVGGRMEWLGTFSDPEAAHRAFIAASIKVHGEFARVG